MEDHQSKWRINALMATNGLKKGGKSEQAQTETRTVEGVVDPPWADERRLKGSGEGRGGGKKWFKRCRR